MFGFEVAYDPRTRDAIVKSEDTIIYVNQRIEKAWVNDLLVPFEGLGFVHEGRLLLSIRAIADYMGLYVHYEGETRQALIADAAYPYVHTVNDERPGHVPIDFETYTTYPIVDVIEERITGRTLLFSDSPEVFRDLGILYRDTVDGKARLFLTHVNGLQKEAKVGWIAANDTSEPITLEIIRQGIAPKSKDYAGQGRTALAKWFAGGEAETIVIPPNSSNVLFESESLQYYQATHAIFDMESDGPLRYDIVAADAAEELAVSDDTPFATRDIHDRGTFPVSDIHLEADAREWEAGLPVRIRIGAIGSLNDHWVTGVDAVTGESTYNFGNYGVMYHLTVKHPGKAAYVIVPLRGLYKGTAAFNGNIIESGTLRVGDGHLLGHTSGKESEVQLQLSAPSGSMMPFEVLMYPLP